MNRDQKFIDLEIQAWGEVRINGFIKDHMRSEFGFQIFYINFLIFEGKFRMESGNGNVIEFEVVFERSPEPEFLLGFLAEIKDN